MGFMAISPAEARMRQRWFVARTATSLQPRDRRLPCRGGNGRWHGRSAGNAPM